MAAAAVEMTGITKHFSGTTVLHGVDFEVRAGEVHALIGGNGAGKSTLMKILQGVYQPDDGEIRIGGKRVTMQSTHDAQRMGIGMVFQEFSLVPSLTVAQNVFLGREPRTRLGMIDDRVMQERTREIFAEMGEDVDPAAQMDALSTGYWQLTEIAKALAQDSRVLILDEPTASLTANESAALFRLVRTLRDREIAIIYISHRMEEIFEISDRITVLRDGHHIATGATSEFTMQSLIDAIVGVAMEGAFEWQERAVDRSQAPILEAERLSAGDRVIEASFSLYPGEILGIAGLMGSGRTELARALFGVDRASRGSVKIRQHPVAVRSPKEGIAAGLALVPEDRRQQGLILAHSLKENLLLPLLDRIASVFWINDREGKRIAEASVRNLRVKAASLDQPIELLSGGNQQKVVIGKWLATEPDILILDEPTAGVDIHAKTEILAIIRQLADAGKGVIVISSELAELLAVSDRLVVMQDGRTTREIDRRDIHTEEELHHAVQRAG